jgi:hypothetical protein
MDTELEYKASEFIDRVKLLLTRNRNYRYKFNSTVLIVYNPVDNREIIKYKICDDLFELNSIINQLNLIFLS